MTSKQYTSFKDLKNWIDRQPEILYQGDYQDTLTDLEKQLNQFKEEALSNEIRKITYAYEQQNKAINQMIKDSDEEHVNPTFLKAATCLSLGSESEEDDVPFLATLT